MFDASWQGCGHLIDQGHNQSANQRTAHLVEQDVANDVFNE